MYKVDLSKALLDAYKSKNEIANNKTTEQTSLPNVLKFHAEFSEIKIFLKKKCFLLYHTPVVTHSGLVLHIKLISSMAYFVLQIKIRETNASFVCRENLGTVMLINLRYTGLLYYCWMLITLLTNSLWRLENKRPWEQWQHHWTTTTDEYSMWEMSRRGGQKS